MAYNENIPQAADNPSQSQSQLLANFQEISTAFNLNHGDFNDASQGQHTFLQMPEQGAAPATAADEGAVYTKVAGGATELFFREESNGAERQITSAFTGGVNGSFTLPGGLIVKWGTTTMTGASTTVATGLTTLYSVQISPRGDVLRNFAWENPAPPNFNILGDSASTTQVSWIAIGI